MHWYRTAFVKCKRLKVYARFISMLHDPLFSLVSFTDAESAAGMGAMFSDPNLFAKLAANPKTASFLADPSFVQRVCLKIASAPFLC